MCITIKPLCRVNGVIDSSDCTKIFMYYIAALWCIIYMSQLMETSHHSMANFLVSALLHLAIGKLS